MTPEQAACTDSEHEPTPQIALYKDPSEKVWWHRCPKCGLCRMMPLYGSLVS